MELPRLATMLVGSYAPPEWLVDVAVLGDLLPQRIPNPELWKIGPEGLEDAFTDGVSAVITEQLSAGLDVITDGEVRRASYSERFSNALDGIDRDNPGTTISRTSATVAVPRIIGPIERREPVELDGALRILRVFDTPLKMTLPGPFTMAQLCQDDHYADEADRAMAFAGAVRAEVDDLFEAGVHLVQIDEPYLQARPDRARDYALPAIERAIGAVAGRTVLHSCFGYGQYVKVKPDGYPFFAELASCAADDISIEAAQPGLDLSCLTELGDKSVHLGVVDCGSHEVESASAIAGRLEQALDIVPADRLVASPDCGMKYLPRHVARQKLEAMVEGAARVRAGLGA